MAFVIKEHPVIDCIQIKARTLKRNYFYGKGSDLITILNLKIVFLIWIYHERKREIGGADSHYHVHQ